MLVLAGTGFALPLGAAALAAGLALAGWLGAVIALQHPVLHELQGAWRRLRDDLLRPRLLRPIGD